MNPSWGDNDLWCPIATAISRRLALLELGVQYDVRCLYRVAYFGDLSRWLSFILGRKLKEGSRIAIFCISFRGKASERRLPPDIWEIFFFPFSNQSSACRRRPPHSFQIGLLLSLRSQFSIFA